MTSYFSWTDAKKLEFATLVHKKQGHMKTDVSYKVKWETILTELKAKENFSDLSIKSTALQTTFDRFQEAVLKECGISEEGANLSGLPAAASEYVKLIVSMAEEEHKRSFVAKNKKNEKVKIQKGLLTHEIKALASQGESFNLAADQKSDSPSADQRSDSSSPSADDKDSKTSGSSGERKEKGPSSRQSSSYSSKGGKNFVDKFAESMEALTEENEAMKTLEQEEKAMNLRHKEIEFQDRQEEKRRRLELDARSLALQERQLAVMELLLKGGR